MHRLVPNRSKVKLQIYGVVTLPFLTMGLIIAKQNLSEMNQYFQKMLEVTLAMMVKDFNKTKLKPTLWQWNIF